MDLMVLSDGMVHFLEIEKYFNKSIKNYLVALTYLQTVNLYSVIRHIVLIDWHE